MKKLDNISQVQPFTFEGTPEDIKENMSQVIYAALIKHPDAANFYFCPAVEADEHQFEYTRGETDAEFTRRGDVDAMLVKNRAKAKVNIEARERKDLARLMKKYGV